MKRSLRLLRWAVRGWRLFGPPLAPRFPPGQEHPWRLPGRSVFVGDHEYLVREAGPPQAPPVVLIHGLGGSSLAEWYKVAPLLAERFRLILVDHRGHGYGPRVVQRFEVSDDADDVAAVLDQLQVGEVAVAGYSMGGAIAQELAHRHPARVRRLALIASFSHHPRSWWWTRTAGMVITRAWERATGVGTPEVRSGYLLAVGAVERRHARWLWEETHRRDPEAAAAALAALLRFDSRPWLSALRMPALVLIPTSDQLVPPPWQYQLAAGLPDARVVELAGARHEAPWTHHQQVAKALAAFLE